MREDRRTQNAITQKENRSDADALKQKKRKKEENLKLDLN